MVALCPKIKKIVQSAAEAWLPIQRSRQKFATDFEPFDPEDSEWDRFPFAGENTTPVVQDLQGLYILNVFPCISWLEDGCAPTRRSSNRPRRQSTAGSNGNYF
jgi:hypothetical protein